MKKGGKGATKERREGSKVVTKYGMDLREVEMVGRVDGRNG